MDQYDSSRFFFSHHGWFLSFFVYAALAGYQHSVGARAVALDGGSIYLAWHRGAQIENWIVVVLSMMGLGLMILMIGVAIDQGLRVCWRRRNQTLPLAPLPLRIVMLPWVPRAVALSKAGLSLVLFSTVLLIATQFAMAVVRVVLVLGMVLIVFSFLKRLYVCGRSSGVFSIDETGLKMQGWEEFSLLWECVDDMRLGHLSLGGGKVPLVELRVTQGIDQVPQKLKRKPFSYLKETRDGFNVFLFPAAYMLKPQERYEALRDRRPAQCTL